MPAVRDLLAAYRATGADEEADLSRGLALTRAERDPFDRRLPLHITGSAVVVHVPTARVLLRWHGRQRAWLQVGGHGDPGEEDPFLVALREAGEETGLPDLAPWRDPPTLVHVVAVPVPPRGEDPAHEHLDLRYVLVTTRPEDAVAECEAAPLRWLGLDAAVEEVEANLAVTLARVREMVVPSGRERR